MSCVPRALFPSGCTWKPGWFSSKPLAFLSWRLLPPRLVLQVQDPQQHAHLYPFSSLFLNSIHLNSPSSETEPVAAWSNINWNLFLFQPPLLLSKTPFLCRGICVTLLRWMLEQTHRNTWKGRPRNINNVFSLLAFVPLPAGGKTTVVVVPLWLNRSECVGFFAWAQVVQRWLRGLLSLLVQVLEAGGEQSFTRILNQQRRLEGHYHLNIICILNNAFTWLLVSVIRDAWMCPPVFHRHCCAHFTCRCMTENNSA